VTTTTEPTRTTGQLADHERAATAGPERETGRPRRDIVTYALRQLAGCLAVIVCVWLVVMLYRHVQPVALGLTGVVLAGGGVALFVRNRSLSQAD